MLQLASTDHLHGRLASEMQQCVQVLAGQETMLR